MDQLKTLLRQKSSLESGTSSELGEVEQYLHIDLDLEETEEALRLARKQKHFTLERIKYFEKLSKPIVFTKHSAEQLFEMFMNAGYKFANDAHAAKIKNLCCYFANDARGKLDLNKGILLVGNIGNGKTSLMRFFSTNQLYGFRIERALDIASDYKTVGESAVKAYSSNSKVSQNIYGLEDYGYCFDDIGTEEIPAQHYGEKKNVFAEILLSRYDNHLTPFNSTHATTNKDLTEIETIYGSRVYDRMKEMFNIVIFDHGSFR